MFEYKALAREAHTKPGLENIDNLSISGADTFLMVFAAVFISIMVLFSVFGIISHILTSIGLYKMSQKRNLNNAWLSWIPLANSYIIGKLSSNDKESNRGLYFLIATFVASFLIIFDTLGMIVLAIYLVFYIFVIFHLFKNYTKNAVLHTILSVFIPLYFPIVIFVQKDKNIDEFAKEVGRDISKGGNANE